ncbi:hypothetical protein [Thiolapillus sp.]|uniref:hypothetical protein n=3 Tax=Thiolapillus sp. TaxID=2017437 RepID=UPI003AF9F69D
MDRGSVIREVLRVHEAVIQNRGHWRRTAQAVLALYAPTEDVYAVAQEREQACLRPRDRFWDIPVPKIDSAFDNLFVPQPSWSPSTAQQLRKLVAAPYLAPI